MAKQFNPTLNDLLRDQLGVNVHPKIKVSDSIPEANSVKLVANNPNRVGLNFINLSSNVVYIWLENNVSSSRGIRLNANGGNLALNWQYDMTLCSNEWWAISVGGSSNLSVVEVVTNTITEDN